MAFTVTEAQYKAVVTADGEFTLPMEPGFQYLFRSDTDCWIRIAATGAGGAAAVNTAGSILCKAGVDTWIANPATSSKTNAFVHVIRDSADGDAVLLKYQAV